MWIITDQGFVSIVAHDTKPDFVRARARRHEHLVDTFDLFDGDVIDLGPDAPDYRFHADVPRHKAAYAIADAVMDLHYTSHVKEHVARSDDVFYKAMLACWSALHRLQDTPTPASERRTLDAERDTVRRYFEQATPATTYNPDRRDTP